MMGNSVFKVPGGKLVKISLDFDEGTNKINKIKIKGDFFVHPEESIEKLEKELTSAELAEDKLSGRIGDFFRKNKVELFGVDNASLAKAILMCLGRKND